MRELADLGQARKFGKLGPHAFVAAEDVEAHVWPALDNLLKASDGDFGTVVPTHCVNGDAYQAAIVFLVPRTGTDVKKSGRKYRFCAAAQPLSDQLCVNSEFLPQRRELFVERAAWLVFTLAGALKSNTRFARIWIDPQHEVLFGELAYVDRIA